MSKSLEWNNLDYSLLPWIRTGLDVMGFESMTPVQASTIPMLAGNKDVVVDSVTDLVKPQRLSFHIGKNCTRGGKLT